MKKSIVLCLVALPIFLSTVAHAEEPKSFSVAAAPGSNRILITIDTSNFNVNYYLENARVVIGFYDGNRQLVETQSAMLGVLRRSVSPIEMIKEYRTPQESVRWLKGESLEWSDSGPLGGKSDSVARNIKASSGFVSLNSRVTPGKKPLVNLDGAWKFRMASDVNHSVYEGVLTLSLTGGRVTGTIDTFDNSNRAVAGAFSGSNLELSRDTGLDTIQHYRLTKQGAAFTGTFWNEGKYPDSGAIQISR